MDVYAVIMAGGRGTRFWPASREATPKQFLTVAGDVSLLRRTGLRVLPLTTPDKTYVVTNASHVDLAAEHLPELPRENIVGEPVGRNTAPCIALAAAMIERKDPSGVLLVAPADHWIADEEAFRESARIAVEMAHREKGLVTFGIVPSSPETGYGYIESGDEVSEHVRRVARFTEKPDRPTAEQFLAGGRHFWNSGIFAWRADVFLAELEKTEPAMAQGCREIAASSTFDQDLATKYGSLNSISVDYAVLESSEQVYVVRAGFPWSDVGSWDALADLLSDGSGNNVVEGDAIAVDSDGCLVRSESRFTAVVGATDLLVVDTPDALLVCPKDRAQDVKRVVEALEAGKRRELL